MHPERDGTVTLEMALHTHINISFLVSLLRSSHSWRRDLSYPHSHVPCNVNWFGDSP